MRINQTIMFKDGKAIPSNKHKSHYRIEYREDNEVIIHWYNYQCRFTPHTKTMTVICYNDGIARLVTRQSIPNEPLNGLLILKDRPEYHLQKFVDWCSHHHIDTVRSKKPNRVYSMTGELITNGLVYQSTTDDGYPCRVVENANWVIIKYQFETVLFTRESIFKLDIPIIERTPA